MEEITERVKKIQEKNRERIRRNGWRTWSEKMSLLCPRSQSKDWKAAVLTADMKVKSLLWQCPGLTPETY